MCFFLSSLLLERYTPPVLPHMYEVNFWPVIDNIEDTPEAELEAIENFMKIENDQDRTAKHLLRTSGGCWCDAGSLMMINNGLFNPFFVVELLLHPWNPEDHRNRSLFQVNIYLNFLLMLR